MDTKKEQVFVGVFVLVAAALLLVTVLGLTTGFGRHGIEHRTYFKFAGGLQPGAAVRYGGMKAGRVVEVRVAPQDSTRIQITFRVHHDTPVKTDSVAEITSLGALGDNYLELSTGSKNAPLAEPGSVIKGKEAFGFSDLSDMAGDLAPVVQDVLRKLDARLDELQVTVARANDLLSDRNRNNVSSTLANLNGMLAEDRPKVTATLDSLQSSTAKVGPLLDSLKKTLANTDTALAHVDSTILENRQDLRQSVVELRQVLVSANTLVDQLNGLVDYNTDNIDETLENMRATTENVRQLTEGLKQRPSSLIRGINVKERRPGELSH